MSALFAGLSFTTPWILAALIALPALWWLLKLTPPLPRTVAFPAIRFLLDLQKKEESTASLPWWLLALRLLIATLVILALAGPALNNNMASRSDGAAVLILDNGWVSAPGWEKRKALLDQLAQVFKEEQRQVYIFSTAARPDTDKPNLTLLPPSDLSGLSHRFTPVARHTDRNTIREVLPELKKLENPEFFWLSDGAATLEEDDALKAIFTELSGLGPVSLYLEEKSLPPHILRNPEVKSDGLTLSVERADGDINRQGIILGRGENGKILFQHPYIFKEDALSETVETTLPPEIRNDLARLEVRNSRSAGSLYLLDDRWQRRKIGLVADGGNRNTPTLLSERHYLQKALLPFYDIRVGELEGLLIDEEGLSMLALGDVGALSAKETRMLDVWVQNGGTLIRFAGPKMANAKSDLLPVPLRSGNRNLDGTMSWSTPTPLGAIPDSSPFAKLIPDRDIRVSKQVLANPSADLSSKTWARLEDGTPIITADQRGDGRLILFHTTATPAWSDLVLSGLFVEMLREISYLGSVSLAGSALTENLPPLSLLDGYGNRIGASETGETHALNLPADLEERTRYPAGYYGHANKRLAHNIGPSTVNYRLLDISAYPALKKSYELDSFFSFVPPLIITIILFVFADMLATLWLQGKLGRMRAKPEMLIVLVSLSFGFSSTGSDTHAEESLERLLDATLQTRLAYVLTGDDTIDRMSEAGLQGLSAQLRRRTAIEAASPLSVNIEKNELLFFPLIYWPLTESFPPLSDEAIRKINKYLKGGGTILFDTRNQLSAGSFGGNIQASAENRRLRSILEKLDIQRLSPVPFDHVLTRAFYLMQSFPGRYQDGDVWVENTVNGSGNDGVASVIIGSHDWAAAWATDRSGRPIAAMVPGGNRQREMATRFGINLVMYTLAGNYKADQVHIPSILERLGQ